METKHVTEQAICQRKNQKKNHKISWNKWKWKYNILNLWDIAKAVLRGKFITINSYIKNMKDLKQPNFQGKSSRNEKKNNLSQKLAEENNKNWRVNKWINEEFPSWRSLWLINSQWKVFLVIFFLLFFSSFALLSAKATLLIISWQWGKENIEEGVSFTLCSPSPKSFTPNYYI